jgi:AraC family transcriptional regulator
MIKCSHERRYAMNWIEGIQRAIDYIESHLTDDIDFESIAAESFSSSYHFQRVFNILCGYTLGEYIRFRRLTLAGEDLANDKLRVIDVALKYGYDSPDSFAKAFQKFHGITPSLAREDGRMLRSFSRLFIKISLEGGKTMNYMIKEQKSFSVIEKVEIHSIENGENLKSIPAFWDRASRDGTLDILSDLTDDKGEIFGICYANPDSSASVFEYSIAATCDENTAVPEGFRKNTIPARCWLIFECVGAMPEAIQDGWKRIVTDFFPTSIYKPTNELDIEVYPDGDTDSPGYRSEIWIPIKK